MASFQQNGYSTDKLDIAVVGGGLVGSLEALYLAKRGHRVRLYEYREDIRKTPLVKGRSINLALSVRGRRALKDVGLEDQIINHHGIPMRGRRIHRLDGTTYVIPYDARTNQFNDCHLAVTTGTDGFTCSPRHGASDKYVLTAFIQWDETISTAYSYKGLEVLGCTKYTSQIKKESENYETVQRHFNHKLVEASLRQGSLMFLKTDTKETVQVKADLIIGADGAFSAVRRAMMGQPLFDYSQKYIEHGYLELCIPTDENGGMPANYLHIWPRGEFMMIALPNQDCSWTVTLFMPFTHFKNIDSEEKLVNFFEKYFPDSIPLIGRKKLIEDFFAGHPSPLVAVKCRPYHVEDRALIIGDAAHAVVPFYGQGMNAGFEDCTLLDQLFQKHNNNLANILEEFSETRWEDTFSISDLAMYNYVEMRDLVTRPSYRLRKIMDDFIFWLLPDLWVPLYNSVTFTTMPYSQCVKNRKWQNKMLLYALLLIMGLTPIGFLALR